MAVATTSLSKLGFVTRGKVRDIYSFPEDDKSLLFVATDRVTHPFHFPSVSFPSVAFPPLFPSSFASPLKQTIDLTLDFRLRRDPQ